MQVRTMMNLIAHADGTEDLLAIGHRIGVDARELDPIAKTLLRNGVFEVIFEP